MVIIDSYCFLHKIMLSRLDKRPIIKHTQTQAIKWLKSSSSIDKTQQLGLTEETAVSKR